MDRKWNRPYGIEIESNGVKKEVLNFIPTGMRLIGLKLYAPNCESNIDAHQIKCMQKSLYGHKEWIYFTKGFDIREENGIPVRIVVDDEAFDSTFCLYHGDREIQKQKGEHVGRSRLQTLNINAVIGQNGAGKSTLIDMIIRMINNLSVSVYGENYVFSSAQHLHYIENVYASLAVYIDDKVKILTVYGHDIYMDTFGRKAEEYQNDEIPEKHNYYKARLRHELLNSKQHDKDKIIVGNRAFEAVLKEWFYTIVSNYSLYAYNYSDYVSERTIDSKIDDLRPQMDDVPDEEDYYWLKGVFHKNDGYQTPVVVNPMRENGYINAKKENLLGKQNLIMLCFRRVTYNGGDGLTEFDGFPFRDINQTHRVVAFTHYWEESSKYEGFANTYLYGKKIHEASERARLESLENAYMYVMTFWARNIGLCKDIQGCEKLYKEGHTNLKRALDYAVFKTFKILQNYTVYNDDFKFFTENFSSDEVDGHLVKLLRDSTHKTRKLRRTLAFIKLFEKHYSIKPHRIDVDDIYAWMQEYVGESLYVGAASENYNIDVDDLLPPPFCNVQVWLVENDKLEVYREQKDSYTDVIPFEGLSSGERQIAYTIGNLLYHAINIDSTVYNFNSQQDAIHYKHLNILMDEVELYFHPDLQRRFVKLLVDALNNSTWYNLTGINITLITHSPFVLSDIPDSNVLCLTRKGPADAFDKTFAANIHDLFNNTFILPSTIGGLAESVIGDFVKVYNNQIDRWRVEDTEYKQHSPHPDTYGWYIENKDKFEYMLGIIGDRYLADELSDMLSELSDFYSQEH